MREQWDHRPLFLFIWLSHELPAHNPVPTWLWNLLTQGAATNTQKKKSFFVKSLDMGRIRRSAREMQSVQPRRGNSSSWVTTTTVQVHWSSPMEKTDLPAPVLSLNTSTRAWGCGLGIPSCSEQLLWHGSSPARPVRTQFLMSPIKAAQGCTCICPAPAVAQHLPHARPCHSNRAMLWDPPLRQADIKEKEWVSQKQAFKLTGRRNNFHTASVWHCALYLG